MLRLVSLFCILLTMFPVLGQSTSKYQVGTITELSFTRLPELAALTPRATTFPSK
jgi:hypothetical protein